MAEYALQHPYLTAGVAVFALIIAWAIVATLCDLAKTRMTKDSYDKMQERWKSEPLYKWAVEREDVDHGRDKTSG